LHQVITKYIGAGDNKAVEPPPSSPEHEESDINSYYNSPEVIKMVRDEFNNTQQRAVAEIKAALKANDSETARRLSHTIKGMAHMMKEYQLSKAAKAVEAVIYGGSVPTKEQLQKLETEMEKVLK
jgi:HPt (histidine-containing phosphotransfer) domain-containing protein